MSHAVGPHQIQSSGCTRHTASHTCTIHLGALTRPARSSKVPRHSKATAQVVTSTVPGLASDGEAASRDAREEVKVKETGS